MTKYRDTFSQLPLYCLVICLFIIIDVKGQKKTFTRADSLRGSIGAGRSWWDIRYYDLQVQPDLSAKTIQGKVIIHFTISKQGVGKQMQLDLQEPLVIDSMRFNGVSISDFYREGNIYWINSAGWKTKPSQQHQLQVWYHGKPKEAPSAPWDGGWVWKKDSLGRPWVTVTCQGFGASVWYPCKDHQSDEPEKGASLTIRVPDSLSAIGNGRLAKKVSHPDKTTSWVWKVTQRINNYNLMRYIGKYVHWKDTAMGEKGKLDLDYWVLDYNLDKAKKQFKQVKPMLRSMEYWFGPYPFYQDGFKLIETWHLGMEHQSAIAYGNQYKMGYRGRDLSESGWGLKWDFIIVHESGHEWFGNNITTKDIADMWIHEGFTHYSETLFIEYHYGKEAADAYIRGVRKGITNKKPLIGQYGVNDEGDLDMYYKGANIIHTIRQVIDNDIMFKKILRGLNQKFYHQTVNSKQIESYISKESGKEMGKIFDQYLRTKDLPVLVYQRKNGQLLFKWTDCIEGFNMPMQLTNKKWVHPTSQWQSISDDAEEHPFSNNFLVSFREEKE